MSKLGEKLHGLIARLGGSHNVVVQDVEDVVKEVTSHLTEAVVPVIEAEVTKFLPGAVQKAISDALAVEREEAQRIATKLEETYRKLVDSHGADAANQAMAQATAPQASVTPEESAPTAS
jgi:signal recognition particle GTPase